jgi:hypothetical protein
MKRIPGRLKVTAHSTRVAHPRRTARFLGLTGIWMAMLIARLGEATRADVLGDASYFNAIPHTLVTFEVDGSGNPVILFNGSSQSMPVNEYAGLGFTFNVPVSWVNDGGVSFDAAQAIGGSPENAIPGGSNDFFRILFTNPVKAFGFWVVNNNTASPTPQFTALDELNQPIEQAVFQGALIDGSIGAADYGFMGISSTTPIHAVEILKQATIFDNFRFAVVPEPASSVIFLVAFGVAVAWHRVRYLW